MIASRQTRAYHGPYIEGPQRKPENSGDAAAVARGLPPELVSSQIRSARGWMSGHGANPKRENARVTAAMNDIFPCVEGRLTYKALIA